MRRRAHVVLTVPWPDDKDQRLDRCVAGVELMREFVQRRGYWPVSRDISIGRAVSGEFINAIHRIKPVTGDMLLVMFSGHGYHENGSAGVSFSPPGDMLSYEALLSEVLRHPEIAKFNEVIVVVDACWSAALGLEAEAAYMASVKAAFHRQSESRDPSKLVLVWSANGPLVGDGEGNEFVEVLCMAAGAMRSYRDLATTFSDVDKGYGMLLGKEVQEKFPFSPFTSMRDIVNSLREFTVQAKAKRP